MELLIVIAIIGILSSMVYPSYRSSIVQAEISDSLSTLSFLASRMESEYMDNRHYNDPQAGTTDCAVAAPTVSDFTLSCTTPNQNSQSYIWQATNGAYT